VFLVKLASSRRKGLRRQYKVFAVNIRRDTFFIPLNKSVDFWEKMLLPYHLLLKLSRGFGIIKSLTENLLN
jgi:hypothetical protein